MSLRKWIGLGGLLLLLLVMQVASSIRQDDWSGIGRMDFWLGLLFRAVLMGSWGWIALYFAGQTKSFMVERLLTGLAMTYFAFVAWICFDILANGNSTSGIAFLFFPAVATVVMLPLMALLAWIGWKSANEAVD